MLGYPYFAVNAWASLLELLECARSLPPDSKQASLQAVLAELREQGAGLLACGDDAANGCQESVQGATLPAWSVPPLPSLSVASPWLGCLLGGAAASLVLCVGQGDWRALVVRLKGLLEGFASRRVATFWGGFPI